MNIFLDTEHHVYARECTVKKINSEQANEFIDKYHRQASTEDRVQAVGLYFNDELLGVATFCAPRTSLMKEKYTKELLRLCFKENTRVVGGASKLITYYKEQYNPSDIFTYQDSSNENTPVYEFCGFTLVKNNNKKRLLESLEKTSGNKIYEWINPNYTFYTYKITSADSDKYYYGVSHLKKGNASLDECQNDGYWGSGGLSENNKFNNWKKKHKDSLQKEVINVFFTRGEAFKNEAELVGDKYNTDKKCLNSTAGGRTAGLNGWKDSSNSTIKNCPQHGKTKFISNKCRKCISQKTLHNNNCLIHGITLFYKDGKCLKCCAFENKTQKTCPVHGETTHQGDICYKCLHVSLRTTKECSVHGLTKYVGNCCYKCLFSPKIETCNTHGETPHVLGKCSTCHNQKIISLKSCPIHGETAFRGESCYKCWGAKSTYKEKCSIHGETKFRKESCCKCTYAKNNITTKDCHYHGEVKHLKEKCLSCQGEESVHKANHKNNLVASCRFCVRRENNEPLSRDTLGGVSLS